MDKKLVVSGALTFGEFYGLGSELSALKHINGTSLTIPGQARDLGALLAAAKYQGGMIPSHGHPQFDDDLATGLARVQLESMDDEEISSIASAAVEALEKEKEPAIADADSATSAEAGEN